MSEPVRWLVTSTDTDQMMIILLAMATGILSTVGTNPVDVAAKRVVQGYDVLFAQVAANPLVIVEEEQNIYQDFSLV